MSSRKSADWSESTAHIPLQAAQTSGLPFAATAAALPLKALPLGATSFQPTSAKALSDAAAEPRKAEDVRDARPRSTPRAAIELLFAAPQLTKRIRRDTSWKALPAPTARLAENEDAAEREAALIGRLLGTEEPLDGAELASELARRMAACEVADLPLMLLEGRARPVFDETDLLKLAVQVAQPLIGGDAKVVAAVKRASDVLASAWPPSAELAMALFKQLEQSLAPLSLPHRYLAQQVERVALERRLFRRRALFGATQIRLDLQLPRADRPLPLYVDESVVAGLPMLLSFPVIVLGELRPREDASEPSPDAFRVLAFARRLDLRDSAALHSV